MPVLRSLLIVLIVVGLSNAQESSDTPVPDDMGPAEIEAADTSGPTQEGFAHYRRKHYKKAVEAFAEARRLAPNEPTTNNNLGYAYLFVGRFQEAITLFQNALAINPQFGPATNGLCAAMALGKKPGNALQVCLKALRADSASATPHYFVGLAYMDLGEPEKALNALEKAARIEPKTPRIYVGLGFACFKLKRYEEALGHFEDARKLNARAEHVLLGLGATYSQLKDYKNAEKALREAVSSNPDNPVARFNLGIVCLARRNRDCALSQYNQLKIMDHPLAKTLFNTLFRDRVVDASSYQKP